MAGEKLDFNVLNRQKKIPPCSLLLPFLGLPAGIFCHSSWLPAVEIRPLMKRTCGQEKSVAVGGSKAGIHWQNGDTDIAQSTCQVMGPFFKDDLEKYCFYLWLACLDTLQSWKNS